MPFNQTYPPVVFDENGQIDFSVYPSAPVLWLNNAVDTICTLLMCGDWRERYNISHSSVLAHPIPNMNEKSPALLTFREYHHQHDEANIFSSIWKYAFATSSTSLGLLTTPAAIIALLVICGCLRIIKIYCLKPLFLSMGRSAARRTHGVEWEREPVNQIRIHKFAEYLFRLLYHSLVSIYGVWFFCDKPWWARHGQLSLFQGFPYQPVEPEMTWYYLIQAAYNLDALVSLLEMSFTIQTNSLYSFPSTTATTKSSSTTNWRFPLTIRWSPTVRGDFREMFVHHVITNALIIGSSYFRLTRAGSMVFLIHDISDIPVDLSKLCNFVKWKRRTQLCFVVMMIVWFITRLYILPLVIYRAILTQSHYLLEEGMSPLLYICYRHMFYTLVGFLIVLHLAWFGMFWNILFTMITKNENHDYTEHKQGEKQQLYNRKVALNGAAKKVA